MSMRISIIVPVYNNPRDLPECLSSIVASSLPDSEIIVVDDASTDETPSVAAGMGVRVLKLEKNSGPGGARNYGARHAQGDILFFVDADVVIARGAIDRVKEIFEANPDLAAVFGSFDSRPRAQDIVSLYWNLRHHFVHQNGSSKASTFWAGCGAIRRRAFEEMGGFDEKRFPYPSIEDIEIGYRLRRGGHKILLDRSLQGTHLKKWTLRSVVLTDITRRAIPWSRLILETGVAPDDLNLKGGQRASFVLVVLGCLFLGLSLLRIEMLGLSAAALLAVVVLNRNLYGFFLRQRGFLFAAACIPLHLLYYLSSGLSYLYVWITMQRKGPAMQKTADRPEKG
jgi:glycosyltransferase involved in cell wall biosynthesis